MAKNYARSTTKLGHVFYTIGVIIAVIMGIGTALDLTWSQNEWLVFILVLVGLVTGFYNITTKEVAPFLIGTVALVVVSSAARLTAIDTLLPRIGTFLDASLSNFIIVVAVAAVVVSFKAVYSLAK